MHSDFRSSGCPSNGSQACAVAASIGSCQVARSRIADVSGSAVEATCSLFGNASLVIAAEGQLAESVGGSQGGTIPMPPLSWRTGGEESSSAPRGRLSAAADMAQGAETSSTVVKPSERQVTRGEYIEPHRGVALSSPTQSGWTVFGSSVLQYRFYVECAPKATPGSPLP